MLDSSAMESGTVNLGDPAWNRDDAVGADSARGLASVPVALLMYNVDFEHRSKSQAVVPQR